MADDWGDIPLQIFRRTLREDPKEFVLDSLMLRVFVELDGRKDLGDLARCLGTEMIPLLGAISRLGALGLVDAVQVEVEKVEGRVFEALVHALSLEVGPVARVFLEQTIEELSYEASEFPARKLPELVERLAHEIPGDHARARFRSRVGTVIGRPAS